MHQRRVPLLAQFPLAFFLFSEETPKVPLFYFSLSFLHEASRPTSLRPRLKICFVPLLCLEKTFSSLSLSLPSKTGGLTILLSESLPTTFSLHRDRLSSGAY